MNPDDIEPRSLDLGQIIKHMTRATHDYEQERIDRSMFITHLYYLVVEASGKPYHAEIKTSVDNAGELDTAGTIHEIRLCIESLRGMKE